MSNNFHEQFFVVCNIFQSHHPFKIFNYFVLAKKGKCWLTETQWFLTPVKVANQLHLDLPALTKHFTQNSSPELLQQALSQLLFGRNFHYSSSSVKEYFWCYNVKRRAPQNWQISNDNICTMTHDFKHWMSWWHDGPSLMVGFSFPFLLFLLLLLLITSQERKRAFLKGRPPTCSVSIQCCSGKIYGTCSFCCCQ